MDFLHRIAEDRIRKAQEEGLFDNLPGNGKPLNLDDEHGVPEDLRMSFKVLKTAHCLPIEMELRKEIFSLQQMIDAATDPEHCKDLRRRLNLRLLDLNLRSKSR